MRELSRTRRCLLFVPAVRPDRFPKALATGTEVVCVDLEDGVGRGAKVKARHEAMAFLADRKPTETEVWLRVNDPTTRLGRLDLEALSDAKVRPDALLLPKVAGADDVVKVEMALTGVLEGVPLVLMIESAKGLVKAESVASATPHVSAIVFGAIDYCADVGCVVDWEALLYARSRVVLAAAAAGVEVLDGPFMDVAAPDGLRDECHGAARLGFTGKIAIHPDQVAIIQGAFAPSPQDIAWARKIIDAYEAAGGGVLLVDGRLIERPVIVAARRMLDGVRAVENASVPPR